LDHLMTTPSRHRETPHRRNRIIAAAAAGALLVAVIAAVAFGGSDDDPSSAANRDGGSSTSTGADADGTASGGPSGTATAGGKGGGKVDPTDDAIVTPTELEPFLLRGSDLPPGWRTLDKARTATDALMGACLRKATTPTVPHALKTISFRSGSNGPVLTSTIRDFTTPALSVRGMTEVRTAVLKCANGTSKPALKTFAFTSNAAAVGVTFTVTQDGTSARGEVIVARVGARSVTLALVGLTEKDLEIGRDAVRTSIARMD